MSVPSFLGGLFGGKPSAPHATFLELRGHAFTLDPKTLGLAMTPGGPRVWGVLMETGFPDAVATLVAIADGTASLYFSNGGGVIGAGGHDGPALAARNLVAAADDYLCGRMAIFSIDPGAPTEPSDGSECFRKIEGKDFPLPQVGSTRFHILTFDGVFGSDEAKEEDLGIGRLPLSPLFYTAHKLITEMRLLEEKRRGRAR